VGRISERKEMKIYVAGPYGRRSGYSVDLLTRNVLIATEIARDLVGMGHSPFVPHLYHWVHLASNEELPEDRWLAICLEWVPQCDAVFRMMGESVGADNEVALAKSLGIPVYYNLKEVPSP
jgi:hypothetical protein